MHNTLKLKDSTLLGKALWSLFFLLTLCCCDNKATQSKESENAVVTEREATASNDGLQKSEGTLVGNDGLLKFNEIPDGILLTLNNTSENFALAFSEVKKMEECRLRSKNVGFYLHKHKVDKVIDRYADDISSLTPEKQKQFTSLRSEYAFILTDYLIQIGKRNEAQNVMLSLSTNATINLQADTTLWLNYLYHQGKVNFQSYEIEKAKERILKGYDCLIQCYILSSRNGYKKYEGLSMQALSMYFLNDDIFTLAKEFDAASIRYINEDGVNDDMLAGNLAERALYTLQELNEPILIADAWRNLAACYFDIGDAGNSLECLNMAIANPATENVPDLLTRINEQLSMTYAALNDKQMSDIYRNIFLDQQDSTRQDRQLEARAISLQQATNRIWILVGAALLLFIMLIVLNIILHRLRKKKMQKQDAQDEEIETLTDELKALELQYSNAQRAAVEQRARISIVNGMMPLIDRMRLALQHRDFEYTSELAEAIEQQNNMLTQWIKLKQGAIAPKISTVNIKNVFDIVSRNAKSFKDKGITLQVLPTTAEVKADNALTLFLVNTLVDNARKNTPAGGSVTISCTENREGGYAEIKVSDTGKGMEEYQLEHLFEYKAIKDDQQPTLANTSGAAQESNPSHGFGLQNCRGIIDRYRKISALFSVCSINATSEINKGTTIAFRLPLAIRTLYIFLTIAFGVSANASAQTADVGNIPDSIKDTVAYYNSLASRYGDSIYNANVNGRYNDAVLYSDSCMRALNKAYLRINKNSADTLAMHGYTADLTWWNKQYPADYDLILSMRNEMAVAALALHDWKAYHYNNFYYSRLYKACSADTTLASYCHTMERNEMIANLSMLIMLLLLIMMLPLFWFVYLRHVIRQHKKLTEDKTALKTEIARLKAECDHIHITNNIADNQLSTLKHETMYYPTRIRQQIASEASCNDATADISDIASTMDYYRELYSMLSTQVLSSNLSAYSFSISALQVSELWKNISVHNNIETSTKVLTNKELISFMNTLLKRHNSTKSPVVELVDNQDSTLSQNKRYTTVSFTLSTPSRMLSEEQCANLFTPQTHDIDFLIIRQIVREIGNTTMHYGCGIRCVRNGASLTILVTLPTAQNSNM